MQASAHDLVGYAWIFARIRISFAAHDDSSLSVCWTSGWLCMQALASELVGYLAVTDKAFKGSLAEHCCRVIQKFSPNVRWYVDMLLKVMLTAGPYVQVCDAYKIELTVPDFVKIAGVHLLFKVSLVQLDWHGCNMP
jgi:hypothetical protein